MTDAIFGRSASILASASTSDATFRTSYALWPCTLALPSPSPSARLSNSVTSVDSTCDLVLVGGDVVRVGPQQTLEVVRCPAVRTRSAPRCCASPPRTGRPRAPAACRRAPVICCSQNPGGIVSLTYAMCGPAFNDFTAELTPMFFLSSYVPALKLVSPFRREYTLNTHDGPITPRCESSLPMHGHAAAVRDLHLDLGARPTGRIELPPEPRHADREEAERHDDEEQQHDRGAAPTAHGCTISSHACSITAAATLSTTLSLRVALHAGFVQRALGGDRGEPLVVHDDLDVARDRAQRLDLLGARPWPRGPSVPRATTASPTTMTLAPSARAASTIARRSTAGSPLRRSTSCGLATVRDGSESAKPDATLAEVDAERAGADGFGHDPHCAASSRATASASSMPATFLPPPTTASAPGSDPAAELLRPRASRSRRRSRRARRGPC